jgi:RNA polymerase sigma-70 factor, ECF subfamily
MKNDGLRYFATRKGPVTSTQGVVDSTVKRSAVPENGFRALFDAHVGFVCRALRRLGVSDRDLPDACQETFLVVFRRLPEFEGRASLRTWIYGITLRVAAAQRRRAHVVRERLDVEPPEMIDEGGEARHVQRAQLRLVEEALAGLNEERREVFVLYELEEMTMREVAEALAISENTAFTRLYAARDAIRAFAARREAPGPSRVGGVR